MEKPAEESKTPKFGTPLLKATKMAPLNSWETRSKAGRLTPGVDFNSKTGHMDGFGFGRRQGAYKASLRSGAQGRQDLYERVQGPGQKCAEILWIREWSQIVCAEDGQIEFVTGIIMDITEEKRQESAAVELRAQDR